MWYAQGDFERARTTLTRASALAHEADVMDVRVQAENLFGHLDHRSGNVDAARDRFTRSVEGFRALAINWGIGNALIGLAGIALSTGDTGGAENLLDQATSVLRQAGPWFLNLPCTFAPSWRCSSGTPIRRSRWCVNLSHEAWSSTTSSGCCTC